MENINHSWRHFARTPLFIKESHIILLFNKVNDLCLRDKVKFELFRVFLIHKSC